MVPDPDPGIRSIDLRIRIRILYLSLVAFKMQENKSMFCTSTYYTGILYVTGTYKKNSIPVLFGFMIFFGDRSISGICISVLIIFPLNPRYLMGGAGGAGGAPA